MEREKKLLSTLTGRKQQLMTNNNNIVIKVENLSKQYRHYEMTKPEIKSKFDEIVTFSGVERYIDTPVKRNS